MRKELTDVVLTMRENSLQNYVIAGLASSMLTNGVVRLFENERDHLDSISPHSHRYDFACLVLEGNVRNSIYERSNVSDGDYFQISKLEYQGLCGSYISTFSGRDYCKRKTRSYSSGEVYSMKHDQIHTIEFSRGAKVLFFEGPPRSEYSYALEPVVDNMVIPTLLTAEHMFTR